MKSVKLFCSYLMLIVSILSVTQQAYAQSSQILNINTANVEELQAMKGVGETRAQAIVAYREQHGPFTTVEDLLEVSGIGESTLARNRAILVVE